MVVALYYPKDSLSILPDELQEKIRLYRTRPYKKINIYAN